MKKLIKNIFKTIGIFILLVIFMSIIGGMMKLMFEFIRPLFWVFFGVFFVVLILLIWWVINGEDFLMGDKE